MNKTVRDSSSKQLMKTSDSFATHSHSFKSRGSEKLKTIQSWCDYSDFDNKGIKNQFIVTKRAKLYSKGHSKSVYKDNQNDQNAFKGMSNFQILKRQALILENSSILKGKCSNQQTNNPLELTDHSFHQPNVPPISLKKSQRVLTEAPQNFSEKKYIVNNEFISFKKISVLDKYRQNIKKLNKNKGIDSQKGKNIISSNFLQQMNFQPSFTSKRFEMELEKQKQKKAEEVEKIEKKSSKYKKQKGGSSVAKKFYQTSRYKGSDQFSKSYCQFMHPNLKAKAMQMSNRVQNSNDEMVIICL